MDNIKTFLIFGILVVSLLLWQSWQNDYVQPTTVSNQQSPATQATGNVEESLDELPGLPLQTTQGVPLAQAVPDKVNYQSVNVKTDVIDVMIDPRGADIQQLALLDYPVDAKDPDIPVQFLDNQAGRFFIVQSGLKSDSAAPTHYEAYRSEQDSYTLADGEEHLTVPFYWQSEDGLKVTKTYRFSRNSYLVDVEYQIENQRGERFIAYPYVQFNRQRPSDESMLIYTYTGAVFSTPGNEYEKIDFDDLESSAFDKSASTGWAAMIQHYFVAAMVPQENERSVDFYGRAFSGGKYAAGMKLTTMQVAAGESNTINYQLYLGPKEHQRLEPVAKHLDLAVDYGILTIISQPLFMIMEWIYQLTNNWGWSIVFLTILIKLVFYKLSASSYRSMAGMRKLAPKLTSLKERYGDDKQQFQKAMIELYKTEKINPLGGCLPILVQMPVFLAFYWVLVESVELRQADFMLWINDLTAIDPYFVLPLIFGVSMFIQQKLNPPPQDPTQAMVMKAFPIVFTVFFAFFPAGLVLYWVVNNIISIAQQWYITKQLGAL